MTISPEARRHTFAIVARAKIEIAIRELRDAQTCLLGGAVTVADWHAENAAEKAREAAQLIRRLSEA